MGQPRTNAIAQAVMNVTRLRILRSGFTEEAYQVYEFARLKHRTDAMSYTSHWQHHKIYRLAVNRGCQQHFLEDEWVNQLFFSSLGIPVSGSCGQLHLSFGVTPDGSSTQPPAQHAAVPDVRMPPPLVLKPSGQTQGRQYGRREARIRSPKG